MSSNPAVLMFETFRSCRPSPDGLSGHRHLLRDLLCRCKRAPAIVSRDAGRTARAERVDEVGQLTFQRLLTGNGLLAAFDARSSGRRPDEPPDLKVLRGVVHRDVRVGLEQPDLADTIAADAARRQVRDAPGGKPQADVRD